MNGQRFVLRPSPRPSSSASNTRTASPQTWLCSTPWWIPFQRLSRRRRSPLPGEPSALPKSVRSWHSLAVFGAEMPAGENDAR